VCVLCNDAPCRDVPPADSVPGSSTETALIEAADRLGASTEAIREAHPRLAAAERAEGRRYMMTVHRTAAGQELVAVKGDPQAVLTLCSRHIEAGEVRDLGMAARSAIEADNLRMAESGLRVLGIACRLVPAGADRGPPEGLSWLGLVGMADPLRRGAVRLVRDLGRAGIATVMLTGDQRATAVAIAAELGLSAQGVIEGDELEADPAAAASHRIFARLTPAQKLQVVAALQRAGRRVAMVGDGVNDSPALKVADVGITLAASASEIARDVADIILVGEDLAPLALAFERGRAVHVNMRRAIRFLIATNLSEIIIMLAATATGLARPLSPRQLLWINLLTDVLPAMGLALEPPDAQLMANPPPVPPAPVVSRADFGFLLRDAGLMAGSALVAQGWAGSRRGADIGGTVGFASLVIGQLLYALACSPSGGRLRRGPLAAALAASLGAQAAALFLPGLRNLLGHRLGAVDLSLSAAAGLAPLLLIKALDASRIRG